MTRMLAAQEIAGRIRDSVPGAEAQASETAVVVNRESLLNVVDLLKNTTDLAFDYLVSVTAVDYLDFFEVVYHLVSIAHNHSLELKTRCQGREEAEVPSLVGLYQGADLQEREVYDLMGIRFDGHPNLKRILLWEGFPGHPLRRDYVSVPKQ